MTEESEGFPSRWSRLKRTRKQAVPGHAAPDLPKESLGTEAGTEARPPPADPESEAAAPPDLPSIESLDEDSDFSVFMQEGVPEEQRRLALRKLWRLSPGEIDGLDDYDEDYTIAEMVIKKASDLLEVAKGAPDEQTKKALAAGDGAARESQQPPAGETAAAQATQATEELHADPAATEEPPEEPDKA